MDHVHLPRKRSLLRNLERLGVVPQQFIFFLRISPVGRVPDAAVFFFALDDNGHGAGAPLNSNLRDGCSRVCRWGGLGLWDLLLNVFVHLLLDHSLGRHAASKRFAVLQQELHLFGGLLKRSFDIFQVARIDPHTIDSHQPIAQPHLGREICRTVRQHLDHADYRRLAAVIVSGNLKTNTNRTVGRI